MSLYLPADVMDEICKYLRLIDIRRLMNVNKELNGDLSHLDHIYVTRVANLDKKIEPLMSSIYLCIAPHLSWGNPTDNILFINPIDYKKCPYYEYYVALKLLRKKYIKYVTKEWGFVPSPYYLDDE